MARETDPASTARPTVAVIILNWNAWGDCIECMESVLRQDHPGATIVLCDNGSTDGSRAHIHDWAAGRLCALPERGAMARFSVPPAPKPLTIRDVGPDMQPTGPADIFLVETGANLGFAAGNNAGIRFALARGFDYLWLLNADTVIDPAALTQMLARLDARPDAGLCGSLLCYYDAPDVIQEAGGCAYHPLLGMARRLAPDADRDRMQDWRALEARLGYVSAASCLARRAFVEEIGPLSEDYFLYNEEIDWATRTRGRFALALAEQSIVYHKKGRATGSKSVGAARSASSAYYLWRARRRFTAKYHPLGLASVFVLAALSSTAAVLAGNRKTARAIFRGVLDRPPANG